MPANDDSTVLTDEELLENCYNNFYLIAILQGRLAYFLMSIHAVHPELFAMISDYNPAPVLFYNMLYGIAVNIFVRPNMVVLNPVNRFAFSILGSMMFNYSTMRVYEWLTENYSHRPILLGFLGFLCGRIMMVHFLAFLYHIDSRSNIRGFRRNSAYESMYI